MIPCFMCCTLTRPAPGVGTEEPSEPTKTGSKGIVFKPQKAGAENYEVGGAQKTASSTQGGPWFEYLHSKGYEIDSGLCDVAKDALLASRKQARLSTRFREELLHWHGRTELEVRFLKLGLAQSPRPQQSYIQALHRSLSRVDGPSRLGLAVGRNPRSNEWELFVIQAQSRAHVRAFPRHVRLEQEIELRGELSPEYIAPMLMVTGARGRVHQREIPLDLNQFHVGTSCDQGPGRYQIEVAALGPKGPQVLMNVPVYCGVAPPRHIELKAPRVERGLSYAELERESVGLVNELRQELGLAPLTWDARLAHSARSHSREMEFLDYVGHESPSRGGFSSRLNRVGIFAEMAFENVATGSAPQEILDRLMASPGHRANILHPQVTHFGVGIAIRTPLGSSGQDALFVTQQFARWRRVEQSLALSGPASPR